MQNAWLFTHSSTRRTAVCGPACTVVREGRTGDCPPYPDTANPSGAPSLSRFVRQGGNFDFLTAPEIVEYVIQSPRPVPAKIAGTRTGHSQVSFMMVAALIRKNDCPVIETLLATSLCPGAPLHLRNVHFPAWPCPKTRDSRPEPVVQYCPLTSCRPLRPAAS
jgi:hypothetical protein